MSAHNGDKSRHNRLRKRGIAKRLLIKSIFKPGAKAEAAPAEALKFPVKKGR